MLIAVNCFEVEPMSSTEAGESGTFRSRSALP